MELKVRKRSVGVAACSLPDLAKHDGKFFSRGKIKDFCLDDSF